MYVGEHSLEVKVKNINNSIKFIKFEIYNFYTRVFRYTVCIISIQCFSYFLFQFIH